MFCGSARESALIDANLGQVTDYVRTERLTSGNAGISMSLAAAAAGLRGG